jgi:ATP-dependent DNA helicase RecG
MARGNARSPIYLDDADRGMFLNVFGRVITPRSQPKTVLHYSKDFVTALNNPQKITPPTYLSIDEIVIDGKHILHIFVPESSQVHRCNGRIFDRNEDGDLDITDNTAQVAHLYQRKQATYTENKVYPNIQVKDLRPDLIEKCRRYVRINKNNHPWSDMDDLELQKARNFTCLIPIQVNTVSPLPVFCCLALIN